MKILKAVLLLLLIAFIAIQFFRPAKVPAATDLSVDQKAMLRRWVEASRDTMKARHPIDSLERRRS